MKFKKIIAMLLTLSMVLAMGSFTASADAVDPITLFQFTDGANSVTAATNVPKNTFSASSNYGAYMLDETGTPYSSPVGAGTEEVAGETNTYSILKHSYALSNYYTKAKSSATSTTPFAFTTWLETNPVLSFSAKFRVPSANTNSKTLSFTMTFCEGINTSGGSTGTRYAPSVTLNPSTNTITVTAPGTSSYSVPSITFKRDEWITVDVRTYLNEEQNAVVGIYIDNELVSYSTTSATYSTISLYNFYLHMSSPKVAAYAPFHYEELALKALDISEKPVIPTNEATPEEKVAEDLEALPAPSSTELITGASVNLSTTGNNGSTITWTSTREDIISLDGKVKHLDLQYDTEVTLTATATLEDATATKSFTYTVQAEQRKDFLEYTFDDLADDFNVTAFKAETNEEGKTTYSARNLGTNTGIDTDYFKFGSATVAAFKESATVTSNCEGITNKSGNSLYVHTNGDVSTTEAAYLISNSNYGIASHISDTNETVLVAGYDMYIPEETKASSRKGYLRLNLGGVASSYDFVMYTEIQNGGLVFKINESEIYNTVVPLTYANNKVEVPSDEWFTVQYVIKINPDASGVHSMKVYGIVDGVCYCEQELTLTSLNILINKMDFYICGTDTGMDNITTGFDNLHVTKIPFYTNDFTDGIPANYIYPLNVGCDATAGTITASGRVRNASGNHCLVLAVYDDTDRLQTIKPVDTMDGEGKMYATLTNASDYLVNNYKYKAFMFETLSSLIPQVNAQEVTYSAE